MAVQKQVVKKAAKGPHVFIDTNIFLTFFHFSSDDLGALTNVFASHEHGAANVYLTEQVRDEFRRNREAKIADALKKSFHKACPPAQLPSFLKRMPSTMQ